MKTRQNDKRVHRAVRNIMFNELGISPDKIQDLIKIAVDRRIDECIGKHGGFDNMLRKITRDHIDDMVKKNRWQNPDVIREIVSSEANKVIGTAVRKALITTISEIDNECSETHQQVP